MAPIPTLRLLEAWMETTKWLMQKTMRFPKRLRHSLTNRLEVLAVGIMENITSASYQKGKAKRRQLMAASDRLNRLRVLLRLAHEMEVLSHEAYEEAARRLGEAGALLGGWIKQQHGLVGDEQ